MPSCCYGDEYAEVFTEREASRTARRYGRKGLAGSEQDLVGTVLARGIEGASVLEVGGGVGQLHLELLRRGASHATNVDLSPSWEQAAAELAEESGLSGRVQRIVGDFVDHAGELPEADVVVLHRVVCCYPHWRELLEEAFGKARRILALTFPHDRLGVRVVITLENTWRRITRADFRAYVHPPDEMLALAIDRGFSLVDERSRMVWRTVVLERVG